MKNILSAVLLLASIPLYAAETRVVVRLAEVEGGVSARASSSAVWVAAKVGEIIAPGGEVKTEAGGGAVIAFSDGSKVKLGPATTFAVEGATTLTTSLRLFSGRLHAWVKRANKAEFKVRHSAGVAAVRGTVFGMYGTAAVFKVDLFEGALDIIDIFGRPASLVPGQSAAVSETAGLQRVSSLPPGARPPAEPQVDLPPAPKKTAAALPPTAPETIAESEQLDSNKSPVQEKTVTSTCDATVSPSAPCP